MIDYRDHNHTQDECLETAKQFDDLAEHHDKCSVTFGDPAFLEYARRDRRRAEDWRSRAAWAKDAVDAQI